MENAVQAETTENLADECLYFSSLTVVSEVGTSDPTECEFVDSDTGYGSFSTFDHVSARSDSSTSCPDSMTSSFVQDSSPASASRNRRSSTLSAQSGEDSNTSLEGDLAAGAAHLFG